MAAAQQACGELRQNFEEEEITLSCRKCGKEYPISGLMFSKDGYGGVRRICTGCDSEARKNRRLRAAQRDNAEREKSPVEILEEAGFTSENWNYDKCIVTAKQLASGKTLYNVRATVERSGPSILDLKPVVCEVKTAPEAARTQRKTKKAFIIPDSQNGYMRDFDTHHLDPFHDRQAWWTCIKLIYDIQPDVVILLGDMLDLPEWTDKFFRSPEVFFTLQPAINELAWWIAQIKSRTRAKIYYIEGNHEHRLTRILASHFTQAWKVKRVGERVPLVSIPSFLGLPNLGVEYIDPYPDGEVWLNDNLRVSHGDVWRHKPLDSVRAVLSDARCSEIIGHIHRMEMASKTIHGMRGSVTYTGFCPGTICRLDGPLPKATRRVNWQQGAAVVEYEEGNGLFQIHPILIYSGRAIYEGRKYEPDLQMDWFKKQFEFKF